MAEGVRLHGLAGPPGTPLGRLLGEGLEPVAPFRAVEGCLDRVVAEISPSPTASAGGLPEGAALPEAVAVRLHAGGASPAWAEPVVVAGLAELLRRCRERGMSSIALARADPALLPRMQIGSWFDAPWRTRALRRIPGAGAVARLLALRSRRWLLAAADLAFWQGVREAADREEWRRLAESSYVALVYHRFAGERKTGQERIDIAPRRFRHHLRALRLLGFRPLGADELLAFHEGALAVLPRRSVVITIDDAVADCVPVLRKAGRWRPQVYAPTAELGGRAHWLDGEPVASWEEIRILAEAGAAIGSHARRHRRLTELPAEECQEELSGSLADLRARLRAPLEIVAYPNGDHDREVCAAAAEAGYRAGFTTEKGRNGAGSPRHSLRRVSIHAADGAPAALWKALTGEALPGWWPRRS